jgi:hypothetical protein
MWVENQTKLESEKTRVYAQKPRLKIAFKNSISGLSNMVGAYVRKIDQKPKASVAERIDSRHYIIQYTLLTKELYKLQRDCTITL